ncbi:hypothetical protein GCM10022248_11320 [Nonomuraea soli]
MVSDGLRERSGHRGSHARRLDQLAEEDPASTGGSTTEIRIMFAFNPLREAIFLAAGNWHRWYDDAIPLADKRFTEHLITLKGQEGR